MQKAETVRIPECPFCLLNSLFCILHSLCLNAEHPQQPPRTSHEAELRNE